MEALFAVLFKNKADMKAFACFLKVVGNESYITHNTRQIKSFNTFLSQVVRVCRDRPEFRALLNIMVYEEIVDAYGAHMGELKDDNCYPKYYVGEHFRTESSAL